MGRLPSAVALCPNLQGPEVLQSSCETGRSTARRSIALSKFVGKDDGEACGLAVLTSSSYRISRLQRAVAYLPERSPALRMDQLSQAVEARQGGKNLLQQLGDLDVHPAKRAKLAKAIYEVLGPQTTTGIPEQTLFGNFDLYTRWPWAEEPSALSCAVTGNGSTIQGPSAAPEDALQVMQSVTCISPRYCFCQAACMSNTQVLLQILAQCWSWGAAGASMTSPCLGMSCILQTQSPAPRLLFQTLKLLR